VQEQPVDPDMSFLDRRIASLSPYILPVSTEITPAKKLRKSAILNKMAVIGNNIRQGKTKQLQKQADRQRRLLAIAEGRQDSLPSRPTPSTAVTQPSKESRSEKRDRRAVEKAIKAREDIKKLEKMQGRVRQLDRIDELKGNRLLWIVLMNSEQGMPCHITEFGTASNIALRSRVTGHSR
jgi:hypothetical protein